MRTMAPWLAVLVQLSLASAAFHTPVRGDVPFPWNKCLGSHLASSSSPSETSTNQHKDENEQVVRNSHYIQGLLDNLTHALDRWIITGSKAPQERAKNILQQIRREAMDAQAVEKAELMAQRAGIIPIVSNSLLAMKKELGKTDGEERRKEAERRKEWEAQRTSGQDVSKQGRSALSRRSGDIMMGTVDSNLESFAKNTEEMVARRREEMARTKPELESFANSKTELQSTLQRQQTVSDYSLQEAATKSSELVALAGAGGFDGETMGIGGLDGVLGEIKRRIWVPLAAPPALLEDLGIHPVRGLLLYGKPGCGKTLLARKVGHILSPSRPVTVVSGPELMDKFVGSSEKNLRQVFDNPPEIYNAADEAMSRAALHVIIMDEFDAMARSRGGRSGTGGDQGDAGVARDSVVNQLLAKMDGVDALFVPTLVIGLTNKRSLIDAALLRPGRFEVQIEVPPPKTAAQRVSILRVHTKQMFDAGRLLVRDAPPGTAAAKHAEEDTTTSTTLLTYDELLGLLAAECEGMTGASLAGVARAAASHALERAVMEFSTSPQQHSMMSECLVTQQDFEGAVHDVYESHSNDWSEDEQEEKDKEEENNSTDGDSKESP